MTTLCINIDSDTESWEITKRECERVGLHPERLSAVVGDNRPLAFNQSVYKAMEESRDINESYDPETNEEEWWYECNESLLLLEDDVTFDGDPVNALKVALTTIPPDFMTLHLGANIIGMDTTQWQMPTEYSWNLAKLHNCWQSHATLYSAECVKFILDNLNPEVLDNDNNIFDDWLRRKVLSQGRSYLMKPMIAYQRPRHSEIWNTHADYTGCHYRGNEWLKRNLI